MSNLPNQQKYCRLTGKNLETHLYISYLDKINKEIMTKLFEEGLLSQNNEVVDLEQHIKCMSNEYRIKRTSIISDIRCYK